MELSFNITHIEEFYKAFEEFSNIKKGRGDKIWTM